MAAARTCIKARLPSSADRQNRDFCAFAKVAEEMPKLPPMPRGRRHSYFPSFGRDDDSLAERGRMSRRCFCGFRDRGETSASDPAHMFLGIARGLLRE